MSRDPGICAQQARADIKTCGSSFFLLLASRDFDSTRLDSTEAVPFMWLGCCVWRIQMRLKTRRPNLAPMSRLIIPSLTPPPLFFFFFFSRCMRRVFCPDALKPLEGPLVGRCKRGPFVGPSHPPLPSLPKERERNIPRLALSISQFEAYPSRAPISFQVHDWTRRIQCTLDGFG